jgi:uncharacterized protein
MTRRGRTKLQAEERGARDVAGGRRILLDFEVGGERLPAVFLHPIAERPVPAALLLHGYTSHKERMVESVGRSLLRRGIASLAVDLPMHGEREGSTDVRTLRSPFEVVRQWRAAMAEGHLALGWMGAHPALDGNRLALVGYSLGAFLAVAIAAEVPAVCAVVLAAGGDLPADLPFGALVRTVADPPRAVRRLEGRPLLMVNGRLDRTVRPDQATRLFEAAREPKEIRWYGGGHWPPASEIDAATDWLAARLTGRVGERAGRGVG